MALEPGADGLDEFFLAFQRQPMPCGLYAKGELLRMSEAMLGPQEFDADDPNVGTRAAFLDPAQRERQMALPGSLRQTSKIGGADQPIRNRLEKN